MAGDETVRAVVQFEGETTQAEAGLTRIEQLLAKIEATSARTGAAWKSVIQTMGETGAVRIVGMDKLLQGVEGIQSAMSAGIGVSREYASGMEGVATRAKSTAQAQREAVKATQELSAAQGQARAYWSLRRELMPTEAAPDPFEGVWGLREELQAGGESDAYQMAQLSENEQMYISAIHKHGQAISTRAAITKRATEAQKGLTESLEKGSKVPGGGGDGDGGGFLGGIGRSFQTHLRWMARYIILWRGMQAVQGAVSQWIQMQIALDRSLTLVSVTLGNNVLRLREYREAMFAAAQAGRVSPLEMAPAAVMVGRVLEPEEAEATMTRAAELAFVSGGKVTDITGKLIVMQRQLGVGSDELTGIMDALAGSLRNTHLSYADMVPMLDNAVTYSKRFNMTIEETIGLQAGVAGATGATSSQLDAMLRRLQDIYVVGSDANVMLGNMGVSTVLVGAAGQQVLRPMDDIIADIGTTVGGSQAEIERLSETLFRTGSAGRALFEAMIRNAPLVAQGIRNATQAQDEWQKTLDAMGATWAASIAELQGSWATLLASIKTDTGVTTTISQWSTEMATFARWIREAIDAWEDLQALMPQAMAQQRQAQAATIGGMGMGGPIIGGVMSDIANRGAAFILKKMGIIPEREDTGELFDYPRPLDAGAAAGAGAGAGAVGVGLPKALDVRTMTLEVPEGANFDEVMSDYEDATNRWIQTFVDASGTSWRISREMITDAEQQVLMWDEASQQFRLLNVFLPALQEAIKENTAALKDPGLRFTQFDPVKYAAPVQQLVGYYSKIAKDLGFTEEPSAQLLWGPDDSILKLDASNRVLQLVMHALTEAVEDNTKAQQEGMWNIPSGITAWVPLTSTFYQDIKRPGGGGLKDADIAALVAEIMAVAPTIAGAYGAGGGVGGGLGGAGGAVGGDRVRSFFTGGPEGEFYESATALKRAATDLSGSAYDLSLSARDITAGSYDIYLPPIPKLAAGGIVTRPTLAMLGEGGPEAVVPLEGRGAGQETMVNVSLMIDGKVFARLARKAVLEVM